VKNVEEVLAETWKIQPSKLRARAQMVTEPEDLWKSFVQDGTLTEEEVFSSYAHLQGRDFVSLKGVVPAADALAVLPPAFCQENRILPLELQGSDLTIATDSPDNFEAIDTISSLSALTPIVKIAAPQALTELLGRYLRVDDEIEKLSEELEAEVEEAVPDIGMVEDEETPVVRFVNLLISQAIRDRASDIHVEPGERALKVRYRIDGVLKKVQQAEKTIQNAVISRIKVIANIDIAERRKPQDGRITIRHGGSSIDIRVVTLPTAWGEKVVMRILDNPTEKKSISSLGMSAKNEELFREAVSRPHGMVLVTGPTGSGKSTTLYTVLDEVSSDSVNIITVEDPIERRIEGINQIQINNKAGLSFASSLRAILRADPDVILLGEIRDEETAKIAVDASMTGHLVLSTLHTNGAPDAAARLAEMGVASYLVGSSVSCVIAQRLARRLCTECKIPMDVDPILLKRHGFEGASGNFYGPVGCDSCAETGYRGRVPITEVLGVNEEIESIINHGGSAPEIREAARRTAGFRSLLEDGFDKVKEGLTTLDEILRVTA